MGILFFLPLQFRRQAIDNKSAGEDRVYHSSHFGQDCLSSDKYTGVKINTGPLVRG